MDGDRTGWTRLEHELRVRLRQQAAVATLGQRALADADLAGLMQDAVRLVSDSLEADAVEVRELGPDGQPAVRARGPAGRPPPGPAATIEAVIGAPERPWGVLAAHAARPRDFSADDVHLLEAVANVLALAIDRARTEGERAALLSRERAARAEAEEARRRLAFLAEASTVLAASLDYQATLRSVARLAIPDLADWCLVDVLAEDGAIRRVAVAHLDPERERLGWEVVRRWPLHGHEAEGVPRVLRTGRAQLHARLDDALLSALGRHPDHLALLRGLGLRSAMLVPLAARDRTLGVISFLTAESGRHYTEADLTLAEDLARRAALAVDNARLFEQAAAANRAKDEFLAILSHELRTPLTSILGWARILRQGRLDAEAVVRAIDTIERNARAQAALIDDLLDVSRIVTGNLTLAIRSLPLAQVVQAALEGVRPMAEAKGVTLEPVLQERELIVHGDPARLQQVVWNLLSNAVKFTPAGGRVTVGLDRVGARAQVRVADTGVGLSPEFLPHVFDRFRQADSTLTRAHGGLGLGLAIVRHLVELHGGRVHADSPGEGRGATFTVELPLARAGEARTEVEEAPAPVALAGTRVLVVEDEADSRDMLLTALRQFGAEVRGVASAAEAVALLGAWSPDVLVADISMPGEDGYSLLRRLRTGEPHLRRIPAVAVTAYAREEDRRRALGAGFQVHIAKPVEPGELGRVVSALAHGRIRVAS